MSVTIKGQKGVSLETMTQAGKARFDREVARANDNGNRYLTRKEAKHLPKYLKVAYDAFVNLPEHKGHGVTVRQFAEYFGKLQAQVPNADGNLDGVVSQLERKDLPEPLKALYTVLVRRHGTPMDSFVKPDFGPIDNWFTKGPEDGVEGVDAERAYLKYHLATKPSPKPVVVAVIDSGVDISHEDLRGGLDAKGNPLHPDQDRIWTNPGEVAGDGIDNDGNGFVDDVHGWNFLGTVRDGKPVNVGRTTMEVTREKVRMEQLATQRPLTPEERDYKATIDAAYAKVKGAVPAHYTDTKFDPRATIIGDDPFDFSDRAYGNNDVAGPDPRHGTHVAGIIGAIRDNMKGIMGVASDVKLMPVRAIPDGDEYDKDVANAVRYAVDNGATIINMSFGKAFSPSHPEVQAAFQYAASKDVLIVHAAGNEGLDLDNPKNGHFPDRDIVGQPDKQVPGWLEVGASSAQKGEKLPASFSNYGDDQVDVFAPGVKIPSSVPWGNRYEALSGTSMATPVVAGVAAVLRSYYPQLTADDIKEAIETSVRAYPDLMVNKPGNGMKVKFGELSRTDGVVDLTRAMQAAAEIAKVRDEELAVG